MKALKKGSTKVKIRDLLAAANVIAVISSQKPTQADLKSLFHFGRFKKWAQAAISEHQETVKQAVENNPQIKEYEEKRIELVKKYGTQNGQGFEVVTADEKNYRGFLDEITKLRNEYSDSITNFESQVTELGEIEIELEVKLTISDVSWVTGLSVDDLLLLDCFMR